MRNLILLPIFLFGLVEADAQNRSDHPLQLQVNLSGLVINAAAENFSRRDVVNLEVQDYAVPGISVGYHVSSKLYVGYAFHPNRRYLLEETFSFEGGEDDILINLDHATGTFHTLQGRYSPFNIGLYGSAFFTHVSEASYDLTGSPINEAGYQVGNQFYDDVIAAEWNFKDLNTFGLGLGWNQVFSNGVSFDLGAGFPVRFVKDLYDEVQLIRADDEFTASDIERIEERLAGEEFYFPVQFYFCIGKNF